MARIVLITGGNRGIGYAAAKRFAAAGDTVILTARRTEAGKKAAASLNSERIHFLPVDISDPGSVEALKEDVIRDFGRVDVLINNAAINYDTWHHALNADLIQVSETIDVNLMGAWRMAQAFIPMMRDNAYGRVINVSSGAGALEGMGGGTPAYSISKAALNVLTIKLASNLGDSNVLVNSLCPGWVRTDMGGFGAPRSVEDAAKDIYDLSLNDTLQGKFVRYGQVIPF